ncbi:mother cell sporulation ATPase [[Clostridium] ultunense Esp]|uniref:AAA family ATPase n=1 Tax=Thermicanus aegyptius TaxID=94009 RepID=UPI0002B6F325|nr:AAA family ATPase [Thermicanus aegyptius]CCQ96356.1 mother cell sporulation ATPase [[Clostridium] ultunense Esp]
MSRPNITQTSSRQLSVVIDSAKETNRLSQSFTDIALSYPELKERVELLKAIQELDRLVGLEELKRLIFEIFALLYVNQKRSELGLKTEPQVFHMIFRGNPGTGKTTVARILGNIFREMGVLSKGHLVEVERADLVGEYIGHTAQKTREMMKRALGGILFIDEAYSLTRGGEKDFGREAIDTLVKGMEDYRNSFVLILAGYEDEMERFLQTNPGLPSRFPIQLHFPDYSLEQLLEIGDLMCENREYRIDVNGRFRMKQILQRFMTDPLTPFSNARFVRNLIERAIRHHAVRILKQSYFNREVLMTLRAEDFKEN